VTENEKLRALLAEAQGSLARHQFNPESPACVLCGGESGIDVGRSCPYAFDYDLAKRIDAALAEPVGDWQPHEDPSRTAYVVQVERERDEAVAAFHEATRLRSGIQQARIKAENERDEARAEVETLRAAIDGEPWGGAVLKQQRDEAIKKLGVTLEQVWAAEKERDEARAEVARLKKRFDDQWYECHDGSEQACCKSHE